MTSPKRIHCWIVAVPATALPAHPTRDHAGRTVDPYICGLIAKLQAEVREDRKRLSSLLERPANLFRFEPTSRWAAERAEAEITWHDWPLDFSEPDFDAWERGAVPPSTRWNLPQ